MSQPGPGQGDSEDGLRVMLAFGMVAAALWYVVTQHIDVINALIGAISWLHILPFALVVSYLPVVLDIPFIGGWLFLPAAQVHDFLLAGGFADMTSAARSDLLAASGRVALIIYGPALAWIALHGRNTRVDLQYQKLHSLESMINMQSDPWLTTRIVRAVNPLKKPEFDIIKLARQVEKRVEKADTDIGAIPDVAIALRPGSWNRSLRPQEWLVSGGLCYSLPRHKEIAEVADVIDPREFEFRREWVNLTIQGLSELLSEQLRNPWKGPLALPLHLRALYAVFALFYSYDVKGGNRLLEDLGALGGLTGGKTGQMDRLISAEKGMVDRLNKICTGKQGQNLAKVADQHAWVESAFPRLLKEARAGRGVLPSPAFLWLKAEDRTMWYILNGVGTDANMVECAGAMAHSKAELQIGKPLRRPAMYQAARSLLEDYFDMTEERIRLRSDREVARRLPGQQIDLIASDFDEGAGKS